MTGEELTMMVTLNCHVNDGGVKISEVPARGIAIHSPAAHLEGLPCIGLHEGVEESNIVTVLAHESLHCTIFKLALESGDPDAESTANDIVDDVMPTVAKTREYLGLQEGDGGR